MPSQARTGETSDGWRVNLPLLLLPAILAAYAVSPGPGRAAIYLLVDLSCTAGILLAQRGRPRAQSTMWFVVAVAIAISTAGDTLLFVPILLHGHHDTVPPFTDALYLVAYLTTGVAMALFVRRTGATTRGDVLDASVFTVGCLAVAWPLLGVAEQSNTTTGESSLAVLTAALPGLAFPLVSMLVLCMGLLAATTGAWRVPAVRGLICAAVIGAVATIVLGAAIDAGVYTPGSMYDAGWLPMYLLTLRTALADRRHPVVSMAAGDALVDTTLVTDPALALRRVAALAPEGPRSRTAFRVISSARITALTAALVAAVLSEVAFDLSAGERVFFLVLISVAIGLVGVRFGGLMSHIRNQATEMRTRSLHDAVTGLPNRDNLRDAVITALECGGRHALVFVDLDDFKAVNDTRGHATGDLLLLAVSARLANAARQGDVVARLGGDEFAVLMTGAPDAAELTAERFLRALSDTPIDLDGEQYLVRASAGVTLLEPRPGTSHEAVYQEALVEADIAMYAAKRSGGGRGRRYEATLRTEVLGATGIGRPGRPYGPAAPEVAYLPVA